MGRIMHNKISIYATVNMYFIFNWAGMDVPQKTVKDLSNDLDTVFHENEYLQAFMSAGESVLHISWDTEASFCPTVGDEISICSLEDGIKIFLNNHKDKINKHFEHNGYDTPNYELIMDILDDFYFEVVSIRYCSVYKGEDIHGLIPSITCDHKPYMFK